MRKSGNEGPSRGNQKHHRPHSEESPRSRKDARQSDDRDSAERGPRRRATGDAALCRPGGDNALDPKRFSAAAISACSDHHDVDLHGGLVPRTCSPVTAVPWVRFGECARTRSFSSLVGLLDCVSAISDRTLVGVLERLRWDGNASVCSVHMSGQ